MFHDNPFTKEQAIEWCNSNLKQWPQQYQSLSEPSPDGWEWFQTPSSVFLVCRKKGVPDDQILKKDCDLSERLLTAKRVRDAVMAELTNEEWALIQDKRDEARRDSKRLSAKKKLPLIIGYLFSEWLKYKNFNVTKLESTKHFHVEFLGETRFNADRRLKFKFGVNLYGMLHHIERELYLRIQKYSEVSNPLDSLNQNPELFKVTVDYMDKIKL